MDDQGIDALFADEDSDDETTSADDSNSYIDDGITKRHLLKIICRVRSKFRWSAQKIGRRCFQSDKF